jgi:hypothetical protein
MREKTVCSTETRTKNMTLDQKQHLLERLVILQYHEMKIRPSEQISKK